MQSAEEEIISFVRPYTSVSTERILQVLNSVNYIIENNIPGDFAEIGVWKGGLIMAMAKRLLQLGKNRTIHVYDTFDGMTEAGQYDIDCSGNLAVDIFDKVLCRSSYEETVANINIVNYPNIVYHVGDIRNVDVKTIPNLALLRLDTDWYDLTKFELIHFEPKVVESGIIIIDDYGHWAGCKKAVDEFLQVSPQQIFRSDYTGIHWIKTNNYNELLVTTLDFNYLSCLQDHIHIFSCVQNSIGNIKGCGSYLHDGWSKSYDISTQSKQANLFKLAKQVSTVLEIGVFDGSSALILLMANKKLKVVGIDICEDDYPEKSVNILNKYFSDRYTLLKGKSSEVMCKLDQKFDLIHIDANHNYEFVCNDIENSRRLSHEDTLLVFDDSDNFGVKMALERYKNEFIAISSTNHKFSHCVYKWVKEVISPCLCPALPTVVTMLFNIGNFRTNDWYIDHGKNGILNITYPLVIFTSSDLAGPIRQIREDKGLSHLTTIFVTTLGSSYYYEDLDKITKLQDIYKISNINLVKDTPIYVTLNNSKNYFMELAINNNYHESSHYIWMDFGISYTANNFDSYKINLINIPDKVRFMLISPYNGSNMKEYYKTIYHNVAGSLFSGKAENLLEYCKIYRKTYSRILEEDWYQLDEAVMSIILHEHPNLFSIYVGDYASLITNYSNFNDCFVVSFTALQSCLDMRNYSLTNKILDYLHLGLCYHSQHKYHYLSTRLICDWYLSDTKQISKDVREIILNLAKHEKESCKKFLESSSSILKFYTDGKTFD